MRTYTQEELDDIARHFSYDPETGVLTRLSTGKPVGAPNEKGYLRFEHKTKIYRVHTVGFALANRAWPKSQLDHVNRDPADNRLCNLREASDEKNKMNRLAQTNSKSGVRGVYYDKSKKRWRAETNFDGQKQLHGTFKTKEAAAIAIHNFLSKRDPEFCPTFGEITGLSFMD